MNEITSLLNKQISDRNGAKSLRFSQELTRNIPNLITNPITRKKSKLSNDKSNESL